MMFISCWFGQGCNRSANQNPSTISSVAPTDAPPNPPVDEVVKSSKASQPSTFFENVSQQAGIHFHYHAGREAGEYAILESLGGGVGVFDFDNDGWIDVMLAGGGKLDNKTVSPLPCKVFRNQGDFQFVEVTTQTNLASDRFYNHGVFPGDYDGDGFVDMAISGYGGIQLFHNQGDGTFVFQEVLRSHPDVPWSSSLAWADFNRDGVLDLYVTHYVDWSFSKHPVCIVNSDSREVCAPKDFEGLDDVLLFGDAQGGFHPKSTEIGLMANGKGLGVVASDFDLDGDVDIYVANDTVDNFFYLNDGTGMFVDNAVIAGVAGDEFGVSTGSMGIAVGEFTGDTLPDIWVTNFERELFALYRNEGNGLYTHVSRNAGLAALGGLYVGFGTVSVDMDQDGDNDLVVANGHVSYNSKNSTFKQVPLLLQNDGKGRFTRQKDDAYFAELHSGRGVATADFNNDGCCDLVFSHLEESVTILRGTNKNKQPRCSIRLIGTHSNRDAIGATVELPTRHGVRSIGVNGGGSYLSTSDNRIVFSLADGKAKATVKWPSGSIEDFWLDPASNQSDRTNLVWIEGQSHADR